MDVARRFGDGLRQALELAGLVEETEGAFAQVALAVGRGGVVAEDDERDARRRETDRLQHLQARAAFELDVSIRFTKDLSSIGSATNAPFRVPVTLPLNAGQKLQSAFLTWVRRHTDRVIYTVKYGYATNRDGTFGGLNDFDAHIVYGKVQYKF